MPQEGYKPKFTGIELFYIKNGCLSYTSYKWFVIDLVFLIIPWGGGDYILLVLHSVPTSFKVPRV